MKLRDWVILQMKRIIRFALRSFYIIFAFFCVYLVLLIFFPFSERYFRCEGKINFNSEIEESEVFVKYSSFRWWLPYGSGTDGYLWWEASNIFLGFESFIEETDLSLLIWDYDFGKEQIERKIGRISLLSGNISLNVGSGGIFDGVCKESDRSGIYK